MDKQRSLINVLSLIHMRWSRCGSASPNRTLNINTDSPRTAVIRYPPLGLRGDPLHRVRDVGQAFTRPNFPYGLLDFGRILWLCLGLVPFIPVPYVPLHIDVRHWMQAKAWIVKSLFACVRI